MDEHRTGLTLAMRRLEYGDVEFYHRLTGNPQVMRFITGKAHTEQQTREEVERLVNRFAADPVFGIWVFSIAGAAKPVGVGGLTPVSDDLVEIGYRVLRPLWGRGLGTAIARHLVVHAHLSSPRRFVARITEGNVASQRVLQRLGFTQQSREPNELGTHDLVFLGEP
jgi:RimJ/RimL family protein N-acetyltransferase